MVGGNRSNAGNAANMGGSKKAKRTVRFLKGRKPENVAPAQKSEEVLPRQLIPMDEAEF
jgi:hypothetical protein